MAHDFRVRYYGMDGQELSPDEGAALLGDIQARRVARTEVGEHQVSTVLLVLDHGWGKGPPLIFETMVLPECEVCVRTPNKHAALAAHDQAVAELQAAQGSP